MKVLPSNKEEVFSIGRYIITIEWLIFAYNIYRVNKDISEFIYFIAQLSVVVGGSTFLFDMLNGFLRANNQSQNVVKEIINLVNNKES